LGQKDNFLGGRVNVGEKQPWVGEGEIGGERITMGG